MKVFRLLSAFGLLISVLLASMAIPPNLMAPPATVEASKFIDNHQNLSVDSDSLVEVRESDVFWLTLYAQSKGEQEKVLRTEMLLGSVAFAMTFGVLLIKAFRIKSPEVGE